MRSRQLREVAPPISADPAASCEPERGNGGKRARGNPRLAPAIALGP
jgi:hypothetical protein